MALTQSALNAAQRRSIHFDVSSKNFSSGKVLDILKCKNGPITVGILLSNNLYFKIEIVNQKILMITAINQGSSSISLKTSDNPCYYFSLNNYLNFKTATESVIIEALDIEWSVGYFILSMETEAFSGGIYLSAEEIPAGKIIVESFADALYTGNVQADELKANDVYAETINTTKKITFGNWEFEKPGNDNIVVLTYKKSSS